MTTNKIYLVTDLGPGDGGKGGVVHKISHFRRAHTILKVGGAQGSHGVQTSAGENFAFSQWGCGTFEGVRTHITPRMVVSPIGLLNEAQALRYQGGVHNPFDLLTVDGSALCATPYHGIASRLKEMARGDNPWGTIGTGIGEAFRDSIRLPELAIRVRDLSRPDLRDRMVTIHEQMLQDLAPIIEGGFLPTDQVAVEEEVAHLYDPGFLDYVVEQFQEVARQAKIVDGEHLTEILAQKGVAVVESSHGILTDNLYGFHPHTSAIRTLPCFTQDMLRDAGYGGEIVNIGVCRAYAIRHGAGPLPTADPEMGEHLLPGSNKDENRYQGKVRVGPLDLVLLRYAIEVCGGQSAFDGLAITWFDQIQRNGVWKVCDRYETPDQAFFTPAGEIKVRSDEKEESPLTYQEQLGQALLECRPEIITHELPAQQSKLTKLATELLDEKLGVPVRMLAFGPTETHKNLL